RRGSVFQQESPGTGSQHRARDGQRAPPRTVGRHDPILEKSHRDLAGWPTARSLRGSLMPVKNYKPTSPGRRGMSVSTFEEITKTKPERALTEPLKKTAGRNNNGRITTR